MGYNVQLWRDIAHLSALFHQTHFHTIEGNRWPPKRAEFMNVLVCAHDLTDAMFRYETVFLTDKNPNPAEWGRPWSSFVMRTINVMLQLPEAVQYEAVVLVNAIWAVGNLKEITGVASSIWQDASVREPLRDLETMDLYEEIRELGEMLLEALERA